MHREPACEAINLLEELSLRRWARENYLPAAARPADWHPIVLEEMRLKERELTELHTARTAIGALVPLDPGQWWHIHGPHIETEKSECLLRVPNLAERAAS